MKRFLCFGLITSLLLLQFACSSSSPQPQPANGGGSVVVNQLSPIAGDGFDLRAFGELVKRAPNTQFIQNELNNPTANPRINNLDANGDGIVDAVRVNEQQINQLASKFIVTTIYADGSEQYVASATIERPSYQAQTASLYIDGNPNFYQGQTYHYHHDGISFGEAYFLAYLFSPRHVVYHSTFFPGRGFGYSVQDPVTYRKTVTRTYYQNGNTPSFQPANDSLARNKVASPLEQKASAQVKPSLLKAPDTQREFQKSDPTKRVDAGAFGGNKGNQPVVGAVPNGTPKINPVSGVDPTKRVDAGAFGKIQEKVDPNKRVDAGAFGGKPPSNDNGQSRVNAGAFGSSNKVETKRDDKPANVQQQKAAPIKSTPMKRK